jgi:phosphate transport system substrate-binding protein
MDPAASRRANLAKSREKPGCKCDKSDTFMLFASFASAQQRDFASHLPPMKKPLFHFAIFAAGFTAPLQAQQLSGAGATFPAPLYQRWAVEYNKQVPAIEVNYQSVGSGAGVKNFLQGVVDFGASDAAMTDAEMAKSPRGAVMIPVTAGSVVLAYNLEGVTGLKLSRAALAGIFLGTVTKWNDPAIVAANPDLPLPARPIMVAYRSDGSGTTYVFTQHLAAISPEFDEEVGYDKSVTFPVGVGGKGNEGVTALVKQTPGAIGYVEFGYAEQNKLPVASVENKSGNFIVPTPLSGAAALASVELPENLRAWPVDTAAPDGYPIASFTWLLLYQKYDNAAKLKALKDFVTYGLTEGQSFALDLGYIPLPESVVAKANAALSTID